MHKKLLLANNPLTIEQYPIVVHELFFAVFCLIRTKSSYPPREPILSKAEGGGIGRKLKTLDESVNLQIYT